MDIRSVIEQLVHTDSLEDWGEKVGSLNADQRTEAFEAAKPRWLERMVAEGKLLLHPDVVRELRLSGWIANDKHQRMIWASILASLSGENSKSDFKRIKEKIIKKHGNTWWHDVYKRIKPAYAAKQRIARHSQNIGPGFQTLAQNSVFVSGLVSEDRQEALRMIPKE